MERFKNLIHQNLIHQDTQLNPIFSCDVCTAYGTSACWGSFHLGGEFALPFLPQCFVSNGFLSWQGELFWELGKCGGNRASEMKAWQVCRCIGTAKWNSSPHSTYEVQLEKWVECFPSHISKFWVTQWNWLAVLINRHIYNLPLHPLLGPTFETISRATRKRTNKILKS